MKCRTTQLASRSPSPPPTTNVAETDEQICFLVRAAYSGQSNWRSVNTDCISLQDAIPDSTPEVTASASHRYAAPGDLVKLTGVVDDSNYEQHTPGVDANRWNFRYSERRFFRRAGFRLSPADVHLPAEGHQRRWQP